MVKITRGDNKDIEGMDNVYFEYSIIDPGKNGLHIIFNNR